MISWRSLTLQFLFLVVCKPHLTVADCVESLNPKNWENSGYNITVRTLTATIDLLDANSFEDMMKCSFGRDVIENEDRRHMIPLMSQCLNEGEEFSDVKGVETFLKDVGCKNKLQQKVSFFDFMCMVGKASGLDTFPECKNVAVVEMFLNRFLDGTPKRPTTKQEISTKTSPPPVFPSSTSPSASSVTPQAISGDGTATFTTTRHPTTTTKLTSTVAGTSTKTSSLPVTVKSNRPPASNLAPRSAEDELHGCNKQQTSKENALYSVVGIFALVIMALIVGGTLLCRKRPIYHGSMSDSSPEADKFRQESSTLVPMCCISDDQSSQPHEALNTSG